MRNQIVLFVMSLLIVNISTLIVFSQTSNISAVKQNLYDNFKLVTKNDSHFFKYVFPPVRHNSHFRKHVEVVNVYGAYQQEPAPMGIADYGVDPNTNTSYTVTSPAFLGVVQIYNLSASSTLNNPCVSIQLNVVLNYEYNGQIYALWVQDVALYNTQNNSIYFVDNIWNMTSPSSSVTGVVGNGSVYNSNGIRFYADVASNYPGSPVTLSLPATFCLLVNVTTNSQGQPVIYFWYNDGYGWINYDTVLIANVQNVQNLYFLITGNQYTGSGNFYDGELVLGGPGGGSCAYLYQANISLYLEYQAGSNFVEVQHAYDFGSDTAETSNNVLIVPEQYDGGVYATLTQGLGGLGPL